MEINGRIELVKITGMCDFDLDEHAGQHWAETREDPEDLHTEVKRACHCDAKSFWAPQWQAARAHGYTG